MKKFTDTQKKWALTATMIAVLGCSVSFNPHTNGFASLDMASSSDVAVDELLRGDGEFDVTFARSGKKTTTVVSPKEVEGKASVDCGCLGNGTFVIEQEFKNDPNTIKQLKIATMALMDKMKAGKPEVVKVASAPITAKEIEKEKRTAKSNERKKGKTKETVLQDYDLIRDTVLDACKSDEDEPTYANCMSDELVAILNDSNDGELSDNKERMNRKSAKLYPEAAYKFFTEEIEPLLKEKIQAYASGPSVETSQGNNDAFKTIRNLTRNIPTGYASLRERVIGTSMTAVEVHAVQAQQFAMQYNTSKNPTFKQASLNSMGMVNEMSTQVMTFNQQNLNESFALHNSNINENSIILSAYQQADLDMKRAVLQLQRPQVSSSPTILPATYQFPNSFSLEGVDSIVVVPQSRTLDGTVSGSIPGAVPAPGSRQSTRTGSTTLSNATQAIVIIPQGQSEGIEFGQPRGISAETERAWQQLRAQQGQRIWVQQ